MTDNEMKKRIEELKRKVAEIDNLTDDESLSNEEFDRLNAIANEFAKEYGKLENELAFRSVKTLTHVSDWSKSFLDSFACGTRKVTNKQANIFYRFNQGKPFIYNGRRFDCLGANYRVGFGSLVVTKI